VFAQRLEMYKTDKMLRRGAKLHARANLVTYAGLNISLLVIDHPEKETNLCLKSNWALYYKHFYTCNLSLFTGNLAVVDPSA
jgi:hypothetical protein